MNLSYATYSLGMAVGAVLVGMVRMLEFSLSDIFAMIAILTALWGALSYEAHGQITGTKRVKNGRAKSKFGPFALCWRVCSNDCLSKRKRHRKLVGATY